MMVLLVALLSSLPDGGVPVELPLSSCKQEVDCALVAGRCLKAGVDGGAPAPAECVCAQGWCARKALAPAPGRACTSDATCEADWSGGGCAGEGERGHRFPLQVQGPACACTAGRCAAQWFDPVPCKTWRDCSLSREPVLHPVPASQVPRPVNRPVRPCKDAERDSVCDEKTKTCRVVSWSC